MHFFYDTKVLLVLLVHLCSNKMQDIKKLYFDPKHKREACKEIIYLAYLEDTVLSGEKELIQTIFDQVDVTAVQIV